MMSETKKTLDDKELEEANGGFTIMTRFKEHWYGDSYRYFSCSKCGGADFNVIQCGTNEQNKRWVQVVCKKCGTKTTLEDE